MPELIGKVFFGIWGVFPHVFASQKVRFWGSAEKSRVRQRGMGLAGRDVQSGRTCETELLLTVSLLSASIFSALAGFSQHDRNLSLAMEIKVTTQVDLKEYHLTNCHIGEMEELFGEEESCSLQIGTQRAYFTESFRQTR